MLDFLQRTGRSLILPLVMIPIAVALMLLDATLDSNLPLNAAGSVILQNMGLVFAIGVALTVSRGSPGVIILAVTAGYVLVMLAVEAVSQAFNFLAGSSFITEQWQIFAIIAGFFVVCYLLAYILARRLDLRKSKRRRKRKRRTTAVSFVAEAEGYISALGGQENITKVDNCATRLLVSVNDSTQVDSTHLKALGATGVVMPSRTAVQIIIGGEAEFVAAAMRDVLLPGIAPDEVEQELQSAPLHTYDPAVIASANIMIRALGGEGNIIDVDETAATRMRVVVEDETLVDEEALRAAGARGVMPLGSTFHILLGVRAGDYAHEMQLRLVELRAA